MPPPSPPVPAEFSEIVLLVIVIVPLLRMPPASPVETLPETVLLVSVNVPWLKMPAASVAAPSLIVSPEMSAVAPTPISKMRTTWLPLTVSLSAPDPVIVRLLLIVNWVPSSVTVAGPPEVSDGSKVITSAPLPACVPSVASAIASLFAASTASRNVIRPSLVVLSARLVTTIAASNARSSRRSVAACSLCPARRRS